MRNTPFHLLTLLAVTVPAYSIAVSLPFGPGPIIAPDASGEGFVPTMSVPANGSTPVFGPGPTSVSGPAKMQDEMDEGLVPTTPRPESTPGLESGLIRRANSTQIPSQCNTGTLSCCQSTQMHPSASNASIPGLIGVVASDVLGVLGLDCSPITVIGLGSGGTCANEPLCCQKDSVQTIGLSCVPVNVVL